MENKIQLPSSIDGSTGVVIPPDRKAEEVTNNALEVKRIEHQQQKERRGWVGKIWGEGNNSIINIAGMLILLLLIIGATYTFILVSKGVVETHQQVLDFWNVIIPIITLALGYLFGKGKIYK